MEPRLDLTKSKVDQANLELADIVYFLDDYFDLEHYGPDPVFSEWLPKLYNEISFDWQSYTNSRFHKLFNGLMIEGKTQVNGIFSSAFPSKEIVSAFLDKSLPGDLLFVHHATDYRSGKDELNMGRGFTAIHPSQIHEIKEKGCSLYVVHAPLDFNLSVGTTSAMVNHLGGCPSSPFCFFNQHPAGIVADIEEIALGSLLDRVRDTFQIKRLDLFGNLRDRNITKIAAVAGDAAEPRFIKEAQQLGAQVYIAGEVMSYVYGNWGDASRKQMKKYLDTSPDITIVGCSHVASENLVMRTELDQLLNKAFDIPHTNLTEEDCWR